MTLTLIARNPFTQQIGVAIASGSEDCVNGSLYPTPGSGLVVVQAKGHRPTGATLMQMIQETVPTEDAMAHIRRMDRGIDYRQIMVATLGGDLQAFTGAQCLPWAGHILGRHHIVAGNMLCDDTVLPKMEQAYLDALQAPLHRRLFLALRAGIEAGGDLRGHRSGGVMIFGHHPFEAVVSAQSDVIGALASAI